MERYIKIIKYLKREEWKMADVVFLMLTNQKVYYYLLLLILIHQQCTMKYKSQGLKN